jgi:hypothetical protein
MSVFRSMLVAAAALCMGLAAQAQSFTFTGQGQVVPTGAPSPTGDLPLAVVNTAYDLPGAGTWALQSAFVFNLVSGTGSGSFSFSQGADSLFGTLSTVQAVVAGASGFEITYSVAGGTGAYAGLTGSGSSLTQLLDPLTGPPPYDYLEAGIMTLVPEPGAALLMLGGLFGLVGWRRLQATTSAASGR